MQIQTQFPRLYNTCTSPPLFGTQMNNCPLQMCLSSSVPFPGTPMNSSVSYHKRKSKSHSHLRIRRLARRKRRMYWREGEIEDKQMMKINNWKLFMENQIIIQENEKLRKKALLLHQENQALFFLLHNKLPSHHIENHP